MGYTSAISRALSRLYLACVSLTRVRRPTPKEDSRKADLESEVSRVYFVFSRPRGRTRGQGGPGWLRLAPRHVRALPVAAVAEVEVDGAAPRQRKVAPAAFLFQPLPRLKAHGGRARVGAAVVDGTRALVGVHVPSNNPTRTD